ncbi:MAG: hypothetical protein M0Z69_10525, partial [Actinomycetota bacterium]|nr:hypothetical protein [Actinomycetota bacterium]
MLGRPIGAELLRDGASCRQRIVCGKQPSCCPVERPTGRMALQEATAGGEQRGRLGRGERAERPGRLRREL